MSPVVFQGRSYHQVHHERDHSAHQWGVQNKVNSVYLEGKKGPSRGPL
jgi:hypothetical protein